MFTALAQPSIAALIATMLTMFESSEPENPNVPVVLEYSYQHDHPSQSVEYSNSGM
jgi:hypothetical protein